MKAFVLVVAMAVALSGCASMGGWGAARGPGAKLAGVWERVEPEIPQYMHIRILSGDHFMWASYDRMTGLVAAVGGGTFEFDGRVYIERVEFGTENLPAELIGEDQFFTARLDRDTWYHDGTLSNGYHVEEVWRQMR